MQKRDLNPCQIPLPARGQSAAGRAEFRYRQAQQNCGQVIDFQKICDVARALFGR
jgi:hypothetical protein